MMRYFWAIPAALQLVLAHQPAFSVNNDVLAFPQFEIINSPSHIPKREAQALLNVEEARGESGQDDDDSGADRDAASEEYIELVLRGRRHLCAIPRVQVDMTEENSTHAEQQSLAEREKELVRASNHGWELLEPMKGQCIYYSTGGWWMVSFCYNEGVRQFHPRPLLPGNPAYPPQEDPNIPGYMLGRFSKPLQIEAQAGDLDDTRALSEEQRNAGKALASPVQRQGEASYLVQKLGGGTECDLTGHEREVTVQFHCNPGTQDKIAVFKETQSCVYLMIIHTPRLCGDVAFKPPQIDQPNPIACFEIVADDQVGTWKAGKAAQAAHDLIAEQSSGRHQPLIIGGIEVGAQKLVGGTPERTVKVSKIVKSPKANAESIRYAVTYASSDGKSTTVLNENEIKKRGLKNSVKDLENSVKQVERLAGAGQPWKLDIVQTAEGMELIMTFGDDGRHGEDRAKGAKDAERSEQNRQSDEEPGSHEEYKNKNEL